MTERAIGQRKPQAASLLDALAQNWFVVFSILYGAFVVFPFLAPVFMHFGLDPIGESIYKIYSFVCHQLPQRSWFLFGAQPSYSLTAIQSAWQNTTDPMILRQFIGNTEMGWKVAWSDRMFSMYTGVWVFALIWYLLRKRIQELPLWGFILLSLPMFVDGVSHMLSDLAGLGLGFRESNIWLVQLTQNVFPQSFYAGDMLGSFNSWMRLITGALFALGLVWFAFPKMKDTIPWV
jgi:uncharacterized membrane protein